MYQQRLKSAIRGAVLREQGKLGLWQKTIELHSPERIFKMGYSLTTVNGKVINNQEDVKAGDLLETHLQTGIIQSIVK